MVALLVIGMNIVVGAVLLGVAHFVGWAGPSYAAGILTGMLAFASWMRLSDGKWP